MAITNILRSVVAVSSLLTLGLRGGFGAAIRGINNNITTPETHSIMPVRSLKGTIKDPSPVVETMGCLQKKVTVTDDIRCEISSFGEKTIVLKLASDRYVSVKKHHPISCPINTSANATHNAKHWPSLGSFSAVKIHPGTVNDVKFQLVPALLVNQTETGSKNLIQIKNENNYKGKYICTKKGYIKLKVGETVILNKLTDVEITVSDKKPSDIKKNPFPGLYVGGIKIYDM